MPNPNQPTISIGATGEPVRRAQRAVRRGLPDTGLVVDGQFGPETERLIKLFQGQPGVVVDGIVGPATWNALPDGGAMPLLKEGASGEVVRSLQSLLSNGAWGPVPGAVDGQYGPKTRASLEGFQSWAHVGVDGIVGERTWDASLHAMSKTLETQIGLQFVTG
jgi:peptidoglycan hydrolase-like protein with peptidoglycan-binding domain